MTKKVADIFDDWARRGRGEGMEEGHGFAVHSVLDELKLEKPFRFLDFGCGNGWVVRKMAAHDLCLEAWGIDISAEMIGRAEAQRKTPKEHYLRTSIQEWSAPEKFDLIFSMEALYYTVPMETVFESLVKNLAAGGQIIVATDYYRENEESHAWPDDLGVPMDLRSKDEWRTLFVQENLQKVTQRQVCYPETDEMKLELKLEREVHGTTQRYTWKQTVGTLVTSGLAL